MLFSDIFQFVYNIFVTIIAIVFSATQTTCPPGFLGDQCQIECGLTYFQQNTKIVGGSVAMPHSWPAQVTL